MSSQIILSSPKLTDAIVHAAGAITTAAGYNCGAGQVNDGTAVLPCNVPDNNTHRIALERALGNALPVDCFVIPQAPMLPKLLLADMDSTIITVECIDELADFAGQREKVEAVTASAMRGEINFSQALIERVKLLQGLPVAVLQQCFDERIKLTSGAVTMVQKLKAAGAHTVLISGGFAFFVERVAAAAGFDEWHANDLGITDGLLDGTVSVNVDRAAKANTLRSIAERRGIAHSSVLAIGDGANDLEMIEAAGTGIAFRAKPVLEAAARHRIRESDLSIIPVLCGCW